MQKCNLIISFALSFCFLSAANAESVIPPTESETAKEVVPAPVQQHLIDMMQNDFSYEDQKRALSNELELEKLRSEISKTRETYQSVPVAEISTAAPEREEPTAAVLEPVDLPKVLLTSEIGGISRVAISQNNTVKLVRLNEHFILNGHSFMVYNAGNNMPAVKEVTK